MRRLLLLSSLLILGFMAMAISQGTAEANGPEPVHVTNFPDVQTVAGKIRIPSPIPHTRFVVEGAQVSPGSFDNPNSYFDAGTLDTTGFTSVTLSLAGEIQGRLLGPEEIGVLLVPDVPAVIEALRVHGESQFPIRVGGLAKPSPSGLFQSEQVSARLGFPRYRLFFYNETPRTVNAALYVYLAN